MKESGLLKEFVDENGQSWSADVIERGGADYKGRFVLQLASSDGAQSLMLSDVAWNSLRTARRMLATMSTVELCRRLRIGLGRQSVLRMP